MRVAIISPKFVGRGGLNTVVTNLAKILKAHVYLLKGGNVDYEGKIKINSYEQIDFSQYDIAIIAFQPKERDMELYSKMFKHIHSQGCLVLQRMHRYQKIPEGLEIDTVVCNSKVQQELITYDSVIIRNPCTPMELFKGRRMGAIWFMRFGSGQTENIKFTSDKCSEEIIPYLKNVKSNVNIYGESVGVFGWKLKKQFIAGLPSNFVFRGAIKEEHKVSMLCTTRGYLNSTVHGWNEDIGTGLVEAFQYKCMPVASSHYLESGYIPKDSCLFFDKLKEIPELLDESVDNYNDYSDVLKRNRKFIIKNQGIKTTKKKYESIILKYL